VREEKARSATEVQILDTGFKESIKPGVVHLGTRFVFHALDFFDQVDVHILDLRVVLNLPILLELLTDDQFLQLSDAFVHRGHYLHLQSFDLLRTSDSLACIDCCGFFQFDQYFKRETAVAGLSRSGLLSWGTCGRLSVRTAVSVGHGLRRLVSSRVSTSKELLRVNSLLRMRLSVRHCLLAISSICSTIVLSTRLLATLVSSCGGLGVDTRELVLRSGLGWHALLLLLLGCELFLLLNRQIRRVARLIIGTTLILLLLLKLRLRVLGIIGCHGGRLRLTVVVLPVCAKLLTRGLRDDRHHLVLGLYAASMGCLEGDHEVLNILRFVHRRHVLEFPKEPVSFTVSIIKKPIVVSEVLHSGLIREA
jgi:hypothetical protein